MGSCFGEILSRNSLALLWENTVLVLLFSLVVLHSSCSAVSASSTALFAPAIGKKKCKRNEEFIKPASGWFGLNSLPERTLARKEDRKLSGGAYFCSTEELGDKHFPLVTVHWSVSAPLSFAEASYALFFHFRFSSYFRLFAPFFLMELLERVSVPLSYNSVSGSGYGNANLLGDDINSGGSNHSATSFPPVRRGETLGTRFLRKHIFSVTYRRYYEQPYMKRQQSHAWGLLITKPWALYPTPVHRSPQPALVSYY